MFFIHTYIHTYTYVHTNAHTYTQERVAACLQELMFFIHTYTHTYMYIPHTYTQERVTACLKELIDSGLLAWAAAQAKYCIDEANTCRSRSRETPAKNSRGHNQDSASVKKLPKSSGGRHHGGNQESDAVIGGKRADGGSMSTSHENNNHTNNNHNNDNNNGIHLSNGSSNSNNNNSHACGDDGDETTTNDTQANSEPQDDFPRKSWREWLNLARAVYTILIRVVEMLNTSPGGTHTLWRDAVLSMLSASRDYSNGTAHVNENGQKNDYLNGKKTRSNDHDGVGIRLAEKLFGGFDEHALLIPDAGVCVCVCVCMSTP
jgi:hypothetical protein